MTNVCDVRPMYTMYDQCTWCMTNVHDVQLMYAIYNHVCYVSHFLYLFQWALYMWYMTDVHNVRLMYVMYDQCTWCTTDVCNIQSCTSCFSLFKSILVTLIHVAYDCHSVSIYIYKIGKYINWLVLPSSCMITQKPEIELQAEYWPHLHDQGFIWKLWFIAFKWAQEHWKWARIGKYTNWLLLPLLLHDFPKTQNCIASWILATFTWSRVHLEAIIHIFQTSPRALGRGKNW